MTAGPWKRHQEVTNLNSPNVVRQPQPSKEYQRDLNILGNPLALAQPLGQQQNKSADGLLRWNKNKGRLKSAKIWSETCAPERLAVVDANQTTKCPSWLRKCSK